MGVLLATLLRTFFYALALLVNVAASFVLVRRLSPSDYAVFQLVNRRLLGYIAMPVQLLAFWAYRYEAEGLGGGLCLLYFSIAYTLPTLVAGVIASVLLGLAGPLALLVALLFTLRPFFACLQPLLSNLRPVRYSLAVLLYRLVYSLLVMAFVYMFSKGLLGAFSAVLAGTLAMIFAGYQWMKDRISRGKGCKRLLNEWVRALHTPILAFASGLVASLDALLAYWLWGPELVAAFFAASIPATLASEVVSVGLSHLSAYTLATGDLRAVYRTTRAMVSLAAPMLAYIAVNSRWTIELVNPAYRWATLATTFIAVARIIEIVNTGLYKAFEGLQRGGVRAAKKMSKLYLYTLAISTAYTTTLAIVLLTARNMLEALIAWTTAMIASRTVTLILLANLLEREDRLVARETRKTILKTIAYMAIATLLAILLPPAKPQTLRFMQVLLAAIPNLPFHIVAYLATIHAIDPEARTTAKSLLKRITWNTFNSQTTS